MAPRVSRLHCSASYHTSCILYGSSKLGTVLWYYGLSGDPGTLFSLFATSSAHPFWRHPPFLFWFSGVESLGSNGVAGMNLTSRIFALLRPVSSLLKFFDTTSHLFFWLSSSYLAPLTSSGACHSPPLPTSSPCSSPDSCHPPTLPTLFPFIPLLSIACHSPTCAFIHPSLPLCRLSSTPSPHFQPLLLLSLVPGKPWTLLA